MVDLGCWYNYWSQRMVLKIRFALNCDELIWCLADIMFLKRMIQMLLSEGAYISKTNQSSFEAISRHQICFRYVEDAASVWKMKVHESQTIFQNKLNFTLKSEKQGNYSNGRTTVGTQFSVEWNSGCIYISC